MNCLPASHSSRAAYSWIWCVCTILLWIVCNEPAVAHDLDVTGIHIGPDGRPAIHYTANPTRYYILLRGSSLTNITQPVNAELFARTNATLTDPGSVASAQSAFYRVRGIPLESPLDSDGDGLNDVFELLRPLYLNPLNPNDGPQAPPTPIITYPTNATTASFVIFSGQAPANTLIRVEGGAAFVTNVVDGTGVFEVTVPLNPNRLNRLFVSAVNEFGEASPPAPIDILQDSTPPYLFIDVPTNGMVLTTSSTLVAGRVGDALSGFLGLNVTVNGEPANVDVGIGPNGTFQRMPVALEVGTNQFTVVATDRLGNSITKQVTVIRQEPVGSRLLAVSGDLQETNIRRRLTEPLVVKTTHADGSPIANKLVNFQVARSDGRLLPVDESKLAAPITNRVDYSTNGTMLVQLFTDPAGEARVWWTMGTDAGHANNRVTVSSAGIGETAFFCASALALPARQINVGMGNNQRGETFGPAAEPLKVWVSDGNNPVAGIPVTFRVTQGGGTLLPIVTAEGVSPSGPGLRAASRVSGSFFVAAAGAPPGEGGQTEVTVFTSITGHAEVDFTFGPAAGNQTIEATFPGNAGLPAVFTHTALARVPGTPTTFVGLIQDNSVQPVGHAHVELEVAGAHYQTFSDAQGRFAFGDIASGAGHLKVDGMTATSLGTNAIPTNSFPFLQYTILVVPNAENSLHTPALLPRLNTNNAQWYYGTNDLVVTCQGIEGLKMTIKANSMKHPGGEIVSPGRPALVSLNQVHHDNIPMPMPDGASPPFAWTLQPGGATFDPPVAVEYPNMSGLAPGAAAFFLTFNHDTERFEIVASGHVTDDGSKIICDPGAGLTISGWGGNCPPYSVTGDAEKCEQPAGAAAVIPAGGGAGDFAFTDVPIHAQSVSCPDIETFGGVGVTDFTSQDSWLTTFCDCDSGEGGEKKRARIQIKIEVVDKWYWESVTDPGDQAFVINHEQTHVTYVNDFFNQMVTAAQRINNQSYASEDECLEAITEFKSFDWKPALTELNGKHDLLDTRDRPRNRAIKDGICAAPPLQFIAAAASPEALSDVRYRPAPGPWQVTVGGQAQILDTLLSFTVRNIPAPDQFGPLGTGSAPDLVGDDFLRITGVSLSNGVSRYVTSEFFRVRQGEAYQIGNLVFSDTPPATPESLRLTVQPTLTVIGQTTQVHAVAMLANGTSNDVTPRTAFTTYRVSNPAVATIDADGLVTATGRGIVFVTAVNDGASAVAHIDVVPGAVLTTVIGVVLNADGTPAAGLPVTIPGQAPSGVTDDHGRFRIEGVVAGSTTLSLLVQRTGADGNFVGTAEQIVPVADGLTDGGVLILRPAPVVVAAPFAAGTTHVVSIKTNGTLWAWGDNAYGQLGDETTESKAIPVQIGLDTDWVGVAAGERHSLGLKRNGSLWAWGDNLNGQLGLPDFATFSPTRVGTNTDWVAVAAGSRHSLALKFNGTLWVCGRNNRGQLGTGGVTDSYEFVQLGSGTTWARVAAGFEHTLALQTDGSLWAWGANSSGQIGDGTTTALKTVPVRVGAETDWANLAAGREHSLALKLNGTLWSWGSSFYGQAADPSGLRRSIPTQVGTASDWVAIAAGANHSIAIQQDGSLSGWGLNYLGQLGQGTCSDASTNPVPISASSTWKAIAAGAEFTVALSVEDSVWTWGANDKGQLARGYVAARTNPLPVEGHQDWSVVTGGRWNSVGLKTNGTLWTWGFNYLGELGDGTKVGKPFPVQIGSDTRWFRISTSESHTLALKTDGTLWGWGYNADGQVGVGSTDDQLAPARIGAMSNWTACAAGHSHSAAVKADGTLWTWGLNNSGQLGNGLASGNRTSPVMMGSATDWRAVAVGTSHTLALKTNGTLWAWGNNARGQLGNGTSGAGQPTPAQVGTESNWLAVAGGNLFTVALQTNGSLWAWGENVSGQLGDGTGQNRFAPVRIGTGNDWLRVDAGDDHVVGVRSDGSLWAWGKNSDGQVGDGTNANKWEPIRIGNGTDWQQVSGGESHTSAVRSDGTVWAWGSNRYGQLADPSPFTPTRVGTSTDWGLPPP